MPKAGCCPARSRPRACVRENAKQIASLRRARSGRAKARTQEEPTCADCGLRAWKQHELAALAPLCQCDPWPRAHINA